jgi:hypothetical protein
VWTGQSHEDSVVYSDAASGLILSLASGDR